MKKGDTDFKRKEVCKTLGTENFSLLFAGLCFQKAENVLLCKKKRCANLIVSKVG